MYYKSYQYINLVFVLINIKREIEKIQIKVHQFSITLKELTHILCIYSKDFLLSQSFLDNLFDIFKISFSFDLSISPDSLLWHNFHINSAGPCFSLWHGDTSFGESLLQNILKSWGSTSKTSASTVLDVNFLGHK